MRNEATTETDGAVSTIRRGVGQSRRAGRVGRTANEATIKAGGEADKADVLNETNLGGRELAQKRFSDFKSKWDT